MVIKTVDLIGAAIGWGSRFPDTQGGPKALADFGLVRALQKIQPALIWEYLACDQFYNGHDLLNYHQREQLIIEFSTQLATIVNNAIVQRQFPIIVGGDHTLALGTWSAVVKAYHAAEQFGLIWIDAHMDSHTAQTTPSQAINGMPLAALMGHGDSSLVDLVISGAKLNPAHVVLIGVRSYEAGEYALLKALNVTIFFMEDVKKQGFDNVFQQALSQVTQGTKGFGISIDLDAFDPLIAPGVGNPEPDGLQPQDVLPALASVANHPQLCALEIAEYNPLRDVDNKTALLTQQLLMQFIHALERT